MITFKISNKEGKSSDINQLFTNAKDTYLTIGELDLFNMNKQNSIKNLLIALTIAGHTYTCKSINGKPIKEPLMVKLFFYIINEQENSDLNKIRNIQNYLLSSQNPEEIIAEIKALWFLPQYSFNITIYGLNYGGYVSNSINRDWFSFQQIIEDDVLSKRFYEIPIELRLKMATELFDAVAFLHSNNSPFIFANLAPRNIVFNFHNQNIAFYNYEDIWIKGSIIPDKVEESIWTCLEIAEGISHKASIYPSEGMMLWSLSMAIHSLLFPVAPFFYLNAKSKKDIRFYLANHKWLDSERLPNYLKLKYSYYIDGLVNLPEEIFHAFANTFNTGYTQAESRTNTHQWYDAFNPNKELLVSFTADRDVVVRGMPVKLRWLIKGDYKTVMIDKIGDVTSMSEIEVLPDRDIIYKIAVTGKYNEVKESVTVLVFPLPIIEEIKLPFPEFEFETNLRALFDKKFDIEVKLPEFQVNNLIVNAGLPDIKFASTPRFYFEAPKLDFNINLDLGIKVDQALINNAITEDLARLELPKTSRIFSRIYKALKKKKNGYSN